MPDCAEVKAKQEHKKCYNKNLRQIKFSPESLVWLYSPKRPKGVCLKLLVRYLGPFYVTLVGEHDTYRIRHCEKNKEHGSPVHVSRLQ